MFYTSLITSLLPYLLLLGVFGTLLVNQCQGADTTAEQQEMGHILEKSKIRPGHMDAISSQETIEVIKIKSKQSTQSQPVNPPIFYPFLRYSAGYERVLSYFIFLNGFLGTDLSHPLSLRGPPALNS